MPSLSNGVSAALSTSNGMASDTDTRPRVTEQDGASWGFHVADVNLALGNLVADVRREESAYRAQH